jgi:hypothetical protein
MKISRLASIVEEERNLCDEGVDQQSTPCDSDSSKKDEVAAADHDINIASLINTAELLKKEKSGNWLLEFKEWMDENSEKTEGNNLSFNLTNGNGTYMRQKKRQKPLRETSNNMSDSVHTSEGGSSSNLLEPDLSFTDTADANGVIKEPSNEVNVHQDHLKMHLNSFRRPPPLELVDTSHSDCFSELDNGSKNMLPNGTPSSTMSKLIEPSSSYAYHSPQSPPQYKEDILHRRLFLEEEFFKISGDLHSLGSLGSDSSCSDDSSDELCSCNSEDDCVAIQAKMDLALNGQMPSFPFVSRYHEEKNSLDYFSGDKFLSDHSTEDEQSCSNDRKFDIKEFHENSKINGRLGHDLGHSVRENGKQKIKRRVFSVFKNNNGTKLEFMKANGDQVDENISLEGNGHLGQSIPLIQGSESHNIMHKNNSSIRTNAICHNRNEQEQKIIEDFFSGEVANAEESETCEQVAFCAYLFQEHLNKYSSTGGIVQR